MFRKKKEKKVESKNEGEVTVPTPPKSEKKEQPKKLDPRQLIFQHKNKLQDLKKLEVELKNIDTDYLYKISVIKQDIDYIEEKLKEIQFTDDQLEQNMEEALAELNRENYEFME